MSVFLQSLFFQRVLTPGIWPGWYTLVLPEGANLQESADVLGNAGVEGIISALSAEVPYMAIPGLESVPIADIDKVLISGDPRKDVFLARVGELFRAGDFSLFYLPADRNITAYVGLLDSLDTLSGYRLPDFHTRGGIRSLLYYLIAVGILIFTSKGKRWRYDLLFSLLWLPLIYFSPPGTWLYALLVFHLSPGRFLRKTASRSPLKTFTLTGGFLLSVSALLIVTGILRDAFSLSSLLAVILPVLLQEFATIFQPFLPENGSASVEPKGTKKLSDGRKASCRNDGSSFFSRKREHSLFEPLSLKGVIRDRSPNRISVPVSSTGIGNLLPVLGAAVLLLMVFSLFLNLFRQGSDEIGTLRIPVPGEAFGAMDSPSAYRRLNEAGNSSSLPDASMLLSSLAFQEGFLYGVDYRLPLPGESLVFRDYVDTGGGLVPTERRLLNYDAEWYRRAQQEWFNSGVGRLLSDAGGTVSVSLELPEKYNVNPKEENTAALLLMGAALLSLFLSFTSTRNPQNLRGTYMPLNTARRRAKAA